MKLTLALIAVVTGLALAQNIRTQDAKKPGATEKAERAPNASGPATPKLSEEELEAKFKATLTRATFTGRWCAIQEGRLGPERDDKYTINSVAKIGGSIWLINARIQYGQTDIVAPIPVQVKWAGDTAVIIVDKVPVPGGGTYSARVLIFEKTYAGSWSGGDHAGLLSGVIVNQAE